MDKKFDVVAVGGTFDELHKGHRSLLLKAFESGKEVWIGLTTDEFAKKLSKNHEIASYTERFTELMNFLEKKGFLDRTKIVPLDDTYGPSVSSKELQAIVVSRETEPRAKELNVLRKKCGLSALKIIVINMVPAENHVPISTTRIKDKEIDREGRLIKRKID